MAARGALATRSRSQRADLVRALRALPRRQREAVVLRHLLDLTEHDTAIAMGCSTGTVKSATSRGRAALGDLPRDEPPFATPVPADATVDLNDLVGAPDTTVLDEPPPSTPVVTTGPPTVSDPPAAVPEPIPFLALGDQVMLGAAPALAERGALVDAAVSRQMRDMIPVLEQLRDLHLFGNAVVVHLGTNGPISRETLDAFLATMDDVPNVILVTVRADRSWTADNNALLRAADRDGDNKILLDWETLSANCPGECFYEDGIHLRADGQEYYADLIAGVLGL